ncbi:Trp biosynthesis-associated membrane protein [Nocardioides sp. SYSU D00038]|uniref:Trp biosynthesis-associated membrane protein n=1 Tax=Nocardioides sp. SYSU D00038 TaxID=2812554 RepID=UPI001967DFF9|nr:Trp biosynthesis-associated membrane protein [Nocardioides sp. SYSU D00038]
MADPADRRRRTFAPAVGAGLAGSGLAAVAGHRAWAEAAGGDDRTDAVASAALAGSAGVTEAPAAGALALVALACWGVLLVTRARARRAVALLAVVAAVGVVVVTVAGLGSVPDDVRDALAAGGVDDPEVARTAWPWLCGLGALVSAAAAALALRDAPGWPEMGTRYDAPTAGAAGTSSAGTSSAGTGAPVADDAAEAGDRSSLDLWKAIDEGHDPTA